ncbi:MAG: SAM-dependent methyltransferase [Gammaproteobacteria bacterium]|jgi:SAM-dependent methyltransferase
MVQNMKITRKLFNMALLTRSFISGIFLSAFLISSSNHTTALDLDVPYVESPDEIVEVMMNISDIGPTDYVIDLGTGDGRIVIAAAKRGAKGFGVDLDPELIAAAKANAEKEGVSDKIDFIVQDLFDTNLSQATVITLFLNEEVNLKLRPTLLKLKPGTRIVSHNFDMGDWKPDRYQQLIRNNKGNFLMHDIFYWEVPSNN